jgi:hypothetical protein
VLAWVFCLALGVVCVALGWGWLAPRLPRRVRLAILALVAILSVVAMAVTANVPQDYHPSDLTEYMRGVAILYIQLWVGLVGLVAALAAVGRRRTQNAGLWGVGLYVAGVGLILYWMLEGEATLQAPMLLFVGAAIALAAAARLMRLARWPARIFGLATGVGIVLAAEALRGPGGRGDGPAAASSDLLGLVAVGAVLLAFGIAAFVRSCGLVLAGPSLRAAAGLVITGLVLILRGPGEWAPGPNASSATLFGLPLALLVIAVALAIVERAPGASRRVAPQLLDQPELLDPEHPEGEWRSERAWPVTAALLVLITVAALWRPTDEACVDTHYEAEAAPLAGANDTIPASPWSTLPRGAPDIPAFDAVCAHRTPGLSQIPYAYYPDCKWAQVDSSYPIVQASGTLTAIDLSSEDSPWLHTSHDLGLEVAAEPASSWLALNMQGGGPPGTPLHVEVENGGFPDAYRPSAGDRVTVSGRWVFDCGHEPKTEIHPAAIVASEHDEWRTDTAGGPQQARVLRVWMNSAPGVVKVPLAPFDLTVGFPPAPAAGVPSVQVVSGDPSAVQWSIDTKDQGQGGGSGPEAAVHITPPAAHGSAYLELLLGYHGAPAATPPPAYTVTLDRLVVHDNLHRAARNTTGLPGLFFPSLGFPGNGHWFMQAIIGHDWRTLLADAPTSSGDTYSLAGVPPISIQVSGDQHLQMAITGYAENDPSAGVELASGSVDGPPLLSWDAGKLAALCCGTVQAYTPDFGAWTLYYRVSRGDAGGSPQYPDIP